MPRGGGGWKASVPWDTRKFHWIFIVLAMKCDKPQDCHSRVFGVYSINLQGGCLWSYGDLSAIHLFPEQRHQLAVHAADKIRAYILEMKVRNKIVVTKALSGKE